ncbi:hypothetical protein HF086_016304 [Spodoptera exigua]|uniref:FP protein C-terminal domain-containing protein n=1 Tax=Spodoptera exigua TaxID=7107 RepID=A0A922MLJ8_SPOEX|nr:hypothetical protein HF086_016304 [Spodoptera exigua]
MDSAVVIFMIIIILQNVVDSQGTSLTSQLLQLLVRSQVSPEEIQKPYVDESSPDEETMDDPPDYVAYDKPVARVIKDYYKIEQANKNKALIDTEIAKEREVPYISAPNFDQEDKTGQMPLLPAGKISNDDPNLINMLDYARPTRTYMLDSLPQQQEPQQQQLWNSQNPTYTRTQTPIEPPVLFLTFDELVDDLNHKDNNNYKDNKADMSPRAQEELSTIRPVFHPAVRPVVSPALLSESEPQTNPWAPYIESIRNEYKRETQKLRSEIETLQNLVALYKEKVDNLSNRLDEPKKTLPNNNQTISIDVIDHLQKKVKQLQKKIERQQQESQITDLEIFNVPETPNENLINVVMSVAKNMGTDIEYRDIVFAERKGPVDELAEIPNKELLGRPIVVRLANSNIRDQLVRSARLRQGPNTTVVIRERLTQSVKKLFHRTHQAANDHDWKFVWIKHGKIFTKKSENEPTRLIKSDADIKRVFGETVADTVKEFLYDNYQ